VSGVSRARSHMRGRQERPPQLATGASRSLKPTESADEAQEAKSAPGRVPRDGDFLRRRWRSLIGRHPPKTLSPALMDRILAWREQVVEGGDISARSRAILAASLTGKTTVCGAGDHGEANDGRSGARRRRAQAPVRVGAVLIREHAGVLHRVAVLPEGFEWEGRVYASLSAVARAITGVRWNGRRFFALDRSARQVARNTTEQGDACAWGASRGPNSSSHAGVGS
jgi:hypothetical protein